MASSKKEVIARPRNGASFEGGKSNRKKSNTAAAVASSSFSPYSGAAALLNECWKRRVGLKAVVYDSQSGDMTCSKTTYAQASHVLEHQARLQALQEQLDITVQNRGLLFVLLYELLEGPNKAVRGGGSLKRRLLERETELRQAWEESSPEAGPAISQTPSHPRYVRVNTLQSTTAQVTEELTKRGISHRPDPHIPDLLVIPTKDAETTSQLLDLSPAVVLQDKSSCFPAWCLVHGYNNDGGLGEGAAAACDCLDACAAPGNKTTHLAALVAAASQSQKAPLGNVTVHAFDKDGRRCTDLRRRVQRYVGNNQVRVNVVCHDFLSVQPMDYPNVGAILLDPTCSGSGCQSPAAMKDCDDQRLRSLAAFQLSALLHAMSFPNCRRIVYSTCSVHEIENEQVVAQALLRHKTDNPGAGAWTLVAPKCMSSWKRRGRTTENGSLTDQQRAALIRVDPLLDETGGFFVACFERSSGGVADMSPRVVPDVAGNSTVKRAAGRDGTSASQASIPNKKAKKSMTKAEALRRAPPCDAAMALITAKDKGDVHTAKRLKKLAWKQRQRDEKQRRLHQKSKS